MATPAFVLQQAEPPVRDFIEMQQDANGGHKLVRRRKKDTTRSYYFVQMKSGHSQRMSHEEVIRHGLHIAPAAMDSNSRDTEMLDSEGGIDRWGNYDPQMNVHPLFKDDPSVQEVQKQLYTGIPVVEDDANDAVGTALGTSKSAKQKQEA